MRFDTNSIPGLDAALLHAFSGCALTLSIGLFTHAWLSALIVTAISFGKEAFEALGIAIWEPKQSWHDSLVDFEYFGIGIAAAFLLLVLSHHF